MLTRLTRLALRMIRRERGDAFLHAAGLACCALILPYARVEASHDRFPPPDADWLSMRDALKPVVVAAVPLATILLDRWLSGFAERVSLGPDLFALPAGLGLAVALATVSTHALRAATADPVRALRSE